MSFFKSTWIQFGNYSRAYKGSYSEPPEIPSAPIDPFLECLGPNKMESKAGILPSYRTYAPLSKSRSIFLGFPCWPTFKEGSPYLSLSFFFNKALKSIGIPEKGKSSGGECMAPSYLFPIREFNRAPTHGKRALELSMHRNPCKGTNEKEPYDTASWVRRPKKDTEVSRGNLTVFPFLDVTGISRARIFSFVGHLFTAYPGLSWGPIRFLIFCKGFFF